MNINTINLPAAIVTIIFRKLIDIHLGKPAHRILARGPWIIDDLMNSNYIYVYMIGAAFTYIGSQLKKGLLTNLAKRCSTQAVVRWKNKYFLQKRWLRRNRSWILKSLLGTRENQERALNLMTAQIPINSDDADKQRLIEDLKKEVTKNVLNTSLSNEVECEPIEDKIEIAECSNSNRTVTSKSSFYSVIEDNSKQDPNKKLDDDGKPTEIKERGDAGCVAPSGESFFSFETSRSATPELFTASVIRELIPSDGSDDDIVKMQIPVKRRPRRQRKSNSRWKSPQRPLRGTIRRTRSGRVYSFGAECGD